MKVLNIKGFILVCACACDCVFSYTCTCHKPPVSLSTGAVALAAGAGHTCALLTGGGIHCWGQNTYGQLGTGDMTTKLTPTAVMGLGAGGYLSSHEGLVPSWSVSRSAYSITECRNRHSALARSGVPVPSRSAAWSSWASETVSMAVLSKSLGILDSSSRGEHV